MRYLLSTGGTTTDSLTYLKDQIKINLLIYQDQVPLYSGGVNERLTELTESGILSKVDEIMNNLVTRIKSEVKVIYLGSSMSNEAIQVEFSINNESYTYVISI